MTRDERLITVEDVARNKGLLELEVLQVQRLWWLLLPIVLLIGLLTASAGFYTDWLWFKDVGYDGVFWKGITSQLTVGALVVGLVFVLVFINLLLVRRNLLASTTIIETENVRFFPSADRYLEWLDAILRSRFIAWLLVAGSMAIAIVWASGFSGAWLGWEMFINRTSFELADPIFGHDVSYYMFQLPFLSEAYISLFVLLVSLLLVSLLVYSMVRLLSRQTAAGRAAIAHVSGLLALVVAAWAFGNKLSIDRLVYSPRGVAFGASYTDMFASLPLYRVIIALALLLAGGAIINIFVRRTRLTMMLPAALLIVAVVASVIYPLLIERFSVEPNQLERETPYIEHNIKYTRIGFDLDKIVEQQLPAPAPLTAETLDSHQTTVDNIRLLDWRLLNQTYSQLQGIRPYYRFHDIDIDRYVIDGDLQQVMLGVRELSLSEMQSDVRTWLNEHLVYTHGYGAVVSPVTRVTAQGQPEFMVGDVPPRTVYLELRIDQPRIYFGELTNTYAIVNTRTEEFDYPQGSEANATTIYEGEQGVPLNFFNKLMFSLRYGTTKLFLADSIQADSRILYNRNIMERVQTIAPFFTYEGDPYAVIADGRIFWVIDGFTTSSYFPYSEPLAAGGNNYVRNSVKVTVDAYNGTVNFYLVDEADPIITTIDKIFPGLLQPLDAMPESLRVHLRYPESLLQLQANVLGTYHIQHPGLFYNQEDRWSVALEKFENDVRPMSPYYTVMNLPGDPDTDAEFVLVLPITPAGTAGNERHNMIAWLAARSDGDDYGKLHLYHFPKDTVVQGPRQIDARIDQDTDISANLTLWSRTDGSNVVRGNLLVIPVGDTVLYVEPVYIIASGNDLPELKRVIVATRDSIAMRPTLHEALAAIIGSDPGQLAPSDPTAPDADATLQSLVTQLESAMQAAKQAQQSGNWAEYGRQQNLLDQLINQLQQLLQSP